MGARLHRVHAVRGPDDLDGRQFVRRQFVGAPAWSRSIAFAAGKAPATLQPLLTVSGTRLYAFVSSSPLYKNLSTSLSSGTQVANVKALQTALKARGYYTGSIDGTFDSSVQTALEDWQDAQNLSATGIIDTSHFLWLPKGAVISDWQVSLGSSVGGGTALATLYYPGQLEAQAQVGQADISSLKVGQKAQLTVDGHTGTIIGTITSISQSRPRAAQAPAARPLPCSTPSPETEVDPFLRQGGHDRQPRSDHRAAPERPDRADERRHRELIYLVRARSDERPAGLSPGADRHGHRFAHRDHQRPGGR